MIYEKTQKNKRDKVRRGGGIWTLQSLMTIQKIQDY